jgi:hypothetical protein
VTWSAQVGPVLNADNPDALRESIKRAYAEMVEGAVSVAVKVLRLRGSGAGLASLPGTDQIPIQAADRT